MQIRHIFLPDYHLVLSLLKLKSIGSVFKPTKCLVQIVLVSSLLKLRNIGGIFKATKCLVQIRKTL